MDEQNSEMEMDEPEADGMDDMCEEPEAIDETEPEVVDERTQPTDETAALL